jgi:hypothetical protein
MRDELLEQDAQAAEDAFAVAKVRTALLEWDEALRKAREDLAGMRTVAAEWEAEVATTPAQLQQDRATLEGAWAWQSQAEEKAKEVEQLRTSLADKATSLASTEEQLRQERDAHQQAEAQLQQGGPPLLRLGPPSSASVWRERRPRVCFSRSVQRSRGQRQPSSSGIRKFCGSMGS